MLVAWSLLLFVCGFRKVNLHVCEDRVKANYFLLISSQRTTKRLRREKRDAQVNIKQSYRIRKTRIRAMRGMSRKGGTMEIMVGTMPPDHSYS